MKLSELREFTVQRTLFSAPTLQEAIARMRFVQADPIRAPARAQDLILRQRVPGYRAGQLERSFTELDLVEDMLHVYGFLPRVEDAHLHPRRTTALWTVEREHPHLRRDILRYLRERGHAHPRDLHEALGRMSVINGWGGGSAATTSALDMLHYEGRLCVLRREAGIKVFGLAPARERALPGAQRARELLRILANLYAPLPAARVCQLYRKLGERAPGATSAESMVEGFLRRGEWQRDTVEGIDYVWPIDTPVASSAGDGAAPAVRFLAPFDPLVWDRARFEHLWGWAYRFEAYTPPNKRQFGYYALPLLWRHKVIGWVNVRRNGSDWDAAEAGFIDRAPRERAFARAFDEEFTRMREFLRGEPAE